MEQNRSWCWKITYYTVDQTPVVLNFRSKCIYMNDESFLDVSNFINSGKQLTIPAAAVFFHDNVQIRVVWDIADRCCNDPLFADAILNAAQAEADRSFDTDTRKKMLNRKRLLRKHIKNGKNPESDYCGIIGEFSLFRITEFSFSEES